MQHMRDARMSDIVVGYYLAGSNLLHAAWFAAG